MRRMRLAWFGVLAVAVSLGVLCLTEPPPRPVPWVAEPAFDRPTVPGHLTSDPGASPSVVSSDPVEIGACPEPYDQIPVVRTGLDELGRPTWYHRDGSITLRAVQKVRAEGEVLEHPVVVHLTPRRVKAPAGTPADDGHK